MNEKLTDSTVRLILDASKTLKRKSLDLEKIAKDLHATQDWSLVGEALSIICNMANLRPDLFVIRPTRELEREIRKLEEKS